MNGIVLSTTTTSILIMIVLILALIICFNTIRNIKANKEINNKLLAICQKEGFKLETSKNEEDYIISKNDLVIKVMISKIPKNSSVTVNSKLTWCLRWGGKRKGRSYPNQRYMNELIPFLKLKDDKVEKLIILYPCTEKVMRYLNESEIAVVSRCELVYDYRIVNFNELDIFFSENIK